MANICENALYASGSEETMNFISEFLEDNFNADVESYTDDLYAYFDSKWTFPEEKMEELYKAIPDKKDLYIRVLSVEYGNMYHALWYCTEDGWHDA